MGQDSRERQGQLIGIPLVHWSYRFTSGRVWTIKAPSGLDMGVLMACVIPMTLITTQEKGQRMEELLFPNHRREDQGPELCKDQTLGLRPLAT